MELSTVLALYRAGLLCSCNYYCVNFLCIHFRAYISRIKEKRYFHYYNHEGIDNILQLHHRLHGLEFEQALGVGDGQGSLF